MRYQSITSAVKDILDRPLQVLFVAKYKGKQENYDIERDIFASFCNNSLLPYIQVYHLPAG